MIARLWLRRGALLVIVGALSLPVSLAAAAEQRPFPVQLVRVATPTQADRDRLADLGLDLTEHGGDTYIEAVLHSAADAERLAANSFTWVVVVPDLAVRQKQNNELDAAYAEATGTSALPSGRDTYRTLADYNAELRTLAASRPSLVRLFGLNHRSLEGREILGIEISDNVSSKSDGKPVFLIMGLHHAREWPSGEHTMEFAFDLVRNFGSNSRITKLLEKTRVLVVPVVNVDGFEQSRKWGDLVDIREVDEGGTVTILGNPGNTYKRKNCRVADGQNTPPGGCESSSPGAYGIGVDLNRNYGGLWGGPGASDLQADPTYRGPGPFSEPESQAIRELISALQVTTLVTNHTFSNLVLRPPGIRSAGETVDEIAMKALGARMTAQNGYRNIHGWQLYDTTGTTEDWSYNATGGFGYTFEIGPDEFHPPFSEVVDEYVGAGIYAGKGNREAFLIALENAADARQHSVLSGKAPTGAVLKLTKTFSTKTSTGPSIEDRLESELVVSGGNFAWHINPSTRPEVMEHRVRILAEQPARSEVTTKNAVVWTPGDHVDIPFSMPEANVGALKVNLDWPTPDDIDLEVYYVQPDGSLLEVGSSGNFILDKEEALVELPEPGNYVLRAINFASVTTTFTMTAGLYGVAGEDVFGGGVVESYKLTCARPDGTVLQSVWVAVDRGKTKKVKLTECLTRF